MSTQAEEQVLGAMMLSQRACDQVAEVLEGRMFERQSHGELYELIRALSASAKPTDPIAVAAAAERAGKMSAVGGNGRLAELVALTTATSNALHYAQLVVEAWKLRCVVQATQGVLHEVKANPDADHALTALDRAAMELRREFAPARSHLMTAYEGATLLEQRFKNPEDDQAGVATPWTFTPPMRPGCLYVLGGYPADGKTAQAVHFVRSACGAGAHVGLFSIEMPKEQMIARIAANLGAPAARVLSGNVRQAERDATVSAISQLALLDCEIIDHPRITPSDIRRYTRIGRYDFIVVDHLHRFQIASPAHERQELEGIVRDLTDLARETEIPVLLLSQLSRSGDSKRPYPRPTMASLRGTAIIEAEATIVWFIWRERDEEQLPTATSKFICAKNRYGRVGTWDMTFLGSRVCFTEGV